MQTDVPLRALIEACAADLLPLLGVPQAVVVDVLSLEMPASSRRLDNLLLLRDYAGNEWLHLVEWQGYPDPEFLWRVLSYLAWLGLHRSERPIAVTLVYLKRRDDVGDTLHQEVNGFRFWGATFHCVRLWEEDAVAAVRSRQVGLAVLSPLMRGATADLVTEAGQLVLAAEPDRRRQADLLNVLGVLAETLVAPDQFIERFERKRLMESRLFELLMQDKVQELEAKQEAKRKEERAALEAQWQKEREALEAERERAVLEAALVAERERTRWARAVEDTIAVRFPTAPVVLVTRLHDVQDPDRLGELLRVALHAPDLATIERAVAEAAG
jgi:hypothetical protein